MNLFEGIKKDRSNADIGWMREKSPHYEYGYKVAAEKLCKNYEKLGVREKDSLIFPIIFLYRQYLELSLKGIIRDADSRLLKERKDGILEKHKLLDLWDEANSVYEDIITKKSVSLVVTNKNTKKERGIIVDFNKFDEYSFSFRYATDKKGNDNLKGVEYISLNNFLSQINIIINHIENIQETLAHIEDY